MTLKDGIARLERHIRKTDGLPDDIVGVIERLIGVLDLLASLTPEQARTYAQAQRREARLARLHGATSSDPEQWEAIACAATTAAQLFELVGREP